jgi:hypothetical protein
LNRALTDAAGPIESDAKRLAPRLTGSLADSIDIHTMDVSSYTAQVRVGPNYKLNRTGHLLEFGHKTPNGGWVRAYPFLRPAFDANKARAVKRFRDILRREILQYGK